MSDQLSKQIRRKVRQEMKVQAKPLIEDALTTLAIVYAAAGFWSRFRTAWGILWCKSKTIESRMYVVMDKYKRKLYGG